MNKGRNISNWRIAVFFYPKNNRTQTTHHWSLLPELRYSTGKYRQLSTWHLKIAFLAWEGGLCLSHFSKMQYDCFDDLL